VVLSEVAEVAVRIVMVVGLEEGPLLLRKT
jgi:hypothetical protein